MSAVCVDIPVFFPLLLSLLFSQFLRALSTSVCVSPSLPPSLSLLVEEYGFEAFGAEGHSERTAAWRRVCAL